MKNIILFVSFVLIILGFNFFQAVSSEPVHVAKIAPKVTEPKNTVSLKWPGNVTENLVGEAYFSKNYYVVLDGSGSMENVACSNGEKKIDVAKNALKSFVSSISPVDNIALFAFDFNGISERIPLGNNNANIIKSELNRIRAGGGTPLGKALGVAYEKLTQAGKKQLGYGEYHIVVLTDGIASDPTELNRIVSKITSKSPIIVHTIGFCIGANHILNQKDKTYYKSANDPQSLAKGLGDVLAESETFTVETFE